MKNMNKAKSDIISGKESTEYHREFCIGKMPPSLRKQSKAKPKNYIVANTKSS